MEGPDQEEGDGQTEGQQGEEDVGEVGHGEDGHGGDLEGLQDLGSVDKNGHDGNTRVEDHEVTQTVRGKEVAAAGSHDRVFVFQIKVRRFHFLGVTIN